MRKGILIFCLLTLSLFAHAQETCTCSSQLTQMQMQSQLDRDNLNSRIDQLDNNTQTAIAKNRVDTQADIKVQLANQNTFIMQQNLGMIDAILMRVVVALFATSGWFLSLAMLIHYARL